MGLVVSAAAATAMYGSLAETSKLYRDICAAQNFNGGRLITSYFIHFSDTPEQERAARERQLRYHIECTQSALPGDPKTSPDSYRYFINTVARYRSMKAEDFTENAVLLGSSDRIVDTLKAKVEAAGFDEVILYFNLGLKPPTQVKEEMARFMEEVAPHFADTPVTDAAQDRP